MTSKEYAIAHLDKARAVTLSAIKDIPAEKLTAQLPGADNHFLFTIGHLATAYVFFSSALGTTATPSPVGWDKLFGMGAQPVNDSHAYPPMADVLTFWEKAFTEFRNSASNLTDAQLADPAVGGGGFLSNKMDAILSAAWHEGWHAGQLAALRRGLGLKPLFGG